MTDSVDGVTQYTYDAQGQLLTEKVTPVGSTQATRTTVMTYDNYGNIKTKTTNGTTASYGYNSAWKDKLTTFNGASIVYDNLGNPTTYLGHNLTWEKGRQLKSLDSNTYTYNANGIRTSKTVGGVKHTYFLDGTKILKETWGDCTLIPLYDNEDSVCGIIYDDAAYYFHKNLQGDVIGIKNAYGVLVARYTYDAWGKVIAVTNEDGFNVSDNAAHVANANPFRYRGYYYDAEIGMYYLQSRYYDPVVGRFINADRPDSLCIVESVLSINLFCYCKNNCVNDVDHDGNITAKLVAKLILGMLTGVLTQMVGDLANCYITYLMDGSDATVKWTPFTKVMEYCIAAVNGALDAINFLKPSNLGKDILKAIATCFFLEFTKVLFGEKFNIVGVIMNCMWACVCTILFRFIKSRKPSNSKDNHIKWRKQYGDVGSKAYNVRWEIKTENFTLVWYSISKFLDSIWNAITWFIDVASEMVKTWISDNLFISRKEIEA